MYMSHLHGLGAARSCQETMQLPRAGIVTARYTFIQIRLLIEAF